MSRATEMLDKALAEEAKSLQEKFPWAKIGEGTYGGLKAFRWDEKTNLTIGNYTSFSFDVKVLLGGEHRTDWVTTYPFSALWPQAAHIPGHPKTRGDIEIGSDVWFGAEAMVLSGVKIGHGAVIGARAVVTTDVAPYGIYVGSPAVFKRERFDPSVIDGLLEIAWWGWPKERISNALPFLLNQNIQTFIDAVKDGRL